MNVWHNPFSGDAQEIVMPSTGSVASARYLLQENGEPDVMFPRLMAAREAGEERARGAGLSVDGWRQEVTAPPTWVLMPDRRYRIAIRWA